MSHTIRNSSKVFFSLGAGLASLACALLLGCGAGTSAIGTAATSSVKQTGIAMGGQQPVTSSTITLWKAGAASGYGAGASLLYQTSTDSSGNFSLTNHYSCSAGDQLYITAYGGSSTGGAGNNSSIGLMALLGECTVVLQAATNICMTEASTIAGMTAAQQFASVSYGTSGTTTLAASGIPLNIGAPASNTVGLANAMQAVNNLIPNSSCNIPQSVTHTATIQGTSTTVTATAPYLKLATLANILASCINTQDGSSSAASTACSSLFTAAQPSGQTNPPADTIQVALDIATNPTNVGTATSGLFSLSTPSAPFQPALATTSVPNDYTLGVIYTCPTLIAPTGSAALCLVQEFGLQVDSAGNVYILNEGTGTATTSPYLPSVMEFSTTGAPVAMYLNTTSGVAYTKSFVLDPSNNIWVGNNFGTQLTEYASGTTNKYTVTGNNGQMVSDGAGNIFVASANGSVYKLPAGSAAGTAATLVGALPNTKAVFLAFDSGMDLWVSGVQSSSSATDQFVSYFHCTPSSGTKCSSTTTNSYGSATNFTSFPVLNGTAGAPYGLAVDKSDNVFVSLGAAATSTVGAQATGYGCEFALTSSTVSLTTTPTCSSNGLGGLDAPEQAQVDGAGHVWVTNIKNNQLNSTAYAATELSYSGSTFTSLSPTYGFTTPLTQPQYMEIDQAGNVWQGSYGTNGSVEPNYSFTEVIGVAAPMYAPLSLALKNGSLGKSPQ